MSAVDPLRSAGVTDSRAQTVAQRHGGGYLPDFCSGRMVLVVVLAMELVAIILALSRSSVRQNFWLDLAFISLFLLWISLGSAMLLCRLRRILAQRSVASASLLALVVLLMVTGIVSEAAYRIGVWYALGNTGEYFPSDHLAFLVRNLGICAIVGTLMLRYFYVAHQWRTNVELEARSRIDALQARIRPHFLFNSMNTIAELTRSNPEAAEQAVEDLADLFRASLSDQRQRIRLREEIEMAQMYQRIEALRLGPRLVVEWHVDELPMHALIPALTLQPLLENAIYHGIETLPDGGVIRIDGGLERRRIVMRISNPLSPRGGQMRQGNRMALENIRQRLALAYDGEARLEIDADQQRFTVTLRLPLREEQE